MWGEEVGTKTGQLYLASVSTRWGMSLIMYSVRYGLLDTHEYDGVSVSKCGPECGDVIDCRLDSFVREGLVQFPLLFWIQE
jgi:hypothetical protein